MNDWWMTGFAVMTVAAFVMLCLGLWLGYRWGRADREAEATFAGDGKIVFPAQEAEEFWASVKWDAVPAPPPGRAALSTCSPTLPRSSVPLGALVSPPGRATDFIEQLTADTDRWIAEHQAKEIT